jgi:hypothetical protein
VGRFGEAVDAALLNSLDMPSRLTTDSQHDWVRYTKAIITQDYAMPQTDTPPTIEQVKQLAFQLSTQDLLALLNDIQERLYSNEMMQIAESGFQEWNDPEEAIYDAAA